jgi:pyruvate/2-oxoglutarate dehydrogenase complex dihydrolipoamide acyltransferase (E2) component
MAEEQPTFKVVDRRPFNSDGTPRELSAEEREEAERAEKAAAVQEAAVKAASAEAAAPPPKASPPASQTASQPKPKAAAPRAEHEPSRTSGDPLDDPASFLSLIMSLASNAAASLGMMPHPVTGETGVDLKTAKHWIDVLGMLENKTQGNLDEQEAQVLEGLLADLRMQYVSFSGAPTPPPAKFSASDITGGK